MNICQALQLCGEPRKSEQLVFEDFPAPSWDFQPTQKVAQNRRYNKEDYKK
ncbi:MAG: hypothetical protein LBT04_07080 [Prevotellaceae bacterium]|nr:hypothetical protein [Prevotellaceae bacterium]